MGALEILFIIIIIINTAWGMLELTTLGWEHTSLDTSLGCEHSTTWNGVEHTTWGGGGGGGGGKHNTAWGMLEITSLGWKHIPKFGVATHHSFG